jgi:hypothetical protein
MDCAEAYDAAAAAAQGGYVGAGAFTLPSTLSPLVSPYHQGPPGSGPMSPAALMSPLSPGVSVPMLYGMPGEGHPYGEGAVFHMLPPGMGMGPPPQGHHAQAMYAYPLPPQPQQQPMMQGDAGGSMTPRQREVRRARARASCVSLHRNDSISMTLVFSPVLRRAPAGDGWLRHVRGPAAAGGLSDDGERAQGGGSGGDAGGGARARHHNRARAAARGRAAPQRRLGSATPAPAARARTGRGDAARHCHAIRRCRPRTPAASGRCGAWQPATRRAAPPHGAHRCVPRMLHCPICKLRAANLCRVCASFFAPPFLHRTIAGCLFYVRCAERDVARPARRRRARAQPGRAAWRRRRARGGCRGGGSSSSAVRGSRGIRG